MIDYDNAVDNPRLKKSPWISPPGLKQPYDCDADTNEWFEESPNDKLYLFELFGNSLLPVAVLTGPTDDKVDPNRELFRKLALEWKKETWHLSSVKKRMSHLAYLQIIGMGAPALQYIFESLREEPDHWFGALEAIARENPAPHAESMAQLRDAWLEWAELHGY